MNKIRETLESEVCRKAQLLHDLFMHEYAFMCLLELVRKAMSWLFVLSLELLCEYKAVCCAQWFQMHETEMDSFAQHCSFHVIRYFIFLKSVGAIK